MPFLEERTVPDGFAQMVNADVEDLLEQLTLDEKVALTAGKYYMLAPPRRTIPFT
jgi:hypothetical protein